MGIFGPKTPFSSLCKGDGKWGFSDPETLFSRKWGFGALSGVGGIAILDAKDYITITHNKITELIPKQFRFGT